MRKSFRNIALGLLAAAGFMLAPAAFAGGHGHVSVGISLPGLSVGWTDRGQGYLGIGVGAWYPSYGWGGSPGWYGPGWYGASWYGAPAYPVYRYPVRPVRYYGANYYGPTYYGPRYHGPRSHGHRSAPVPAYRSGGYYRAGHDRGGYYDRGRAGGYYAR